MEQEERRLQGVICLRGTDPATCYDKIEFGAHLPRRLDDLLFIISDDFDTLEIDAEGETVFGKIRRVRICGLAFAFHLAILYDFVDSYLVSKHLSQLVPL